MRIQLGWTSIILDLIEAWGTSRQVVLEVTYAFPVLPSASVTGLDAQIGARHVVPWFR